MTVLEQHLADVGSRYRRADLWRYSAWFFVATALLGLWLFYLQISGKWMDGRSGWLLLLGGIAGVLPIACALLAKYRDQNWLVNQVEENYPELDQRLVTTLDEIKKNDGKSLGYLQHTVLLETVSHAHNNGWQNLVSNKTLKSLRTRCTAAFALLMAAAICLMQFRPPESAFAANSLTDPSEIEAPVANYEVLVEPGDVELEKGENLIVVARFGKTFPKVVQLTYQPLSESSESEVTSAPMQQSLDDPLFGGTVYEVTEPIEYSVTYDDNETKRYRVGIYVLPELVRSDAEIEYPSYTELPKKLVEDTRRASAVEGSLLTWKVHVNKPGVVATLVPKDEGEPIMLEIDPANPTTLTTQLRMMRTQSWHLRLVDADGRENRSPPTLTAKVTPNLPAKLKLDLARDARVSPIEEFLVKATVSDDYGLSKAGISYTIKGEEQEVTLVENAARREKSPAEYMLDFESLKAEPDQLLSYHFWAEDRDANGDPRRTMSDMYHTEVRHFEEIFRQGQQPANGQQQQQQQQQGQSQNAQDAEQLAELQKQIINASWNVLRRGVDEGFQEDVSVVLESQQAAIEQADELAQNLEDAESTDHLLQAQEFMQRSLSELTNAYSDKSVESLRKVIPPARGAYEALLKLRAREHEIVQQQQQQSQQPSQSSSRQRFQEQLDQLELENDQNLYETQRQAQDEATQEQKEMRRALNQLKELAQRQEDLNKQLKELQNALEQAESEEEREEIERQLKRLRDQQQEMLRDTDELMDRLEEGQEQEAMQQAQEQLEQTREQMRDASEKLERGEVTPALASGTRAQRELEEMEEELRRASANQFTEQMREMRDEARQIEERQQELGEQISQRQRNKDQQNTGLRESSEEGDVQQETKELRDALRVQRRRVDDLLEEMKQMVEEAAESEPLLAESLYDAAREAEKEQLDEKLEATAQLTERGLNEQAQQLEEDVREGIGDLAEEIDSAAERVLGDQTQALRVAIQTLKNLENELQNEMEQFGAGNPAETEPNGEPREPGERSANDQQGDQEGERQNSDPETQPSASDRDPNREQNGEPREGNQSGERQPGERQSGEPQDNQEPQDREQQDSESQSQQSPGGQPSEQQSEQSSQQPGGQSQQDSESQDQQDQDSPGGQRGQRNQPNQRRSLRGGQPNSDNQNGGIGADWGDRLANPITGDDYREWTDRLRDVEELVDDPELRAEAARIREQAREFRRDFKRHSKEPKWNLIKELVSRPLRELRQEVSAELMRRAAERNAIVPIDKDPVPQQFTEQVRRYYENLGAADSARGNE